MDSFTIRQPDDMHVHFRRGHLLDEVAPFTARVFGRAVVMPNTVPPILTAAQALDYFKEIRSSLEKKGLWFVPFMTIQITDDTTLEMIREAKDGGVVVAGKVYPKGVTTNSHNGVSDFERLLPVFKEMEKVGLVLSIHGQKPESFCLHREYDFLPTLRMIAYACPKLRIVMEHISTREAVRAVEVLPQNVAATITPHHLMYTLHDVLCWVAKDGQNEREGLNPHHYCQPLLQTPEDRDALVSAATSGNPKFFLGSDTAPHEKERKESECGCAGVFNAPVIMPVLAKIFFDKYDDQDFAVKALEQFTSVLGAQFYGFTLNESTITVQRKPWIVKRSYHCIVPLCAGKELEWQVQL